MADTMKLSILVLRTMLSLQPEAPWKDTYELTSEVIAQMSQDEPLFRGDDGPMRTAAVLVSLGWFEGRFRQDAVNAKEGSYCMFQVNQSNFKALGVTREQIQSNFVVCTRAALEMAKVSGHVCSRRPREEFLGHYASGGDTCGGVRASVNRMRKAFSIFDRWKREEDQDG